MSEETINNQTNKRKGLFIDNIKKIILNNTT